MKLAADFELWARFHRSGARLYCVPVPLACFRIHGDQLSRDSRGYTEEAQVVLRRYGGKPATVSGVPFVRRALVRILPRSFQHLAVRVVAGLLSGPTREGLCVVRDGSGWRIEGR
jgi:hypothetical protein